MEIEKEQLPHRKFEITPKTAATSLKSMKFEESSTGGGMINEKEKYVPINANGKIAIDIIKNVAELIGKDIPQSILCNVTAKRQAGVERSPFGMIGYKYQPDKQVYHGRSAISLEIAGTIGTYARNKKLNMQSPEIVCMCGREFMGLIGRAKKTTVSRLEEVMSGKFKFTGESRKNTDLEKNSTLLKEIINFEKELRDALIEYSKQTLPLEEQEKLLQLITDKWKEGEVL